MAQSLIEQLQLGAVDGSAPITDLLRKAKLAAVKLGADDFAAWVDLETAGYFGVQTVPLYRRVAGSIKFRNPFRGWMPVFGAEAVEINLCQPVSELFALSKTETGYVTMTVPEGVRATISRDIGMQLDVRLHFGTNTLGGIVEAVRNKVLEWTLKLEQAGIRGEGLTFTPEEAKAAQAMVVNHNYHGPVASVAHGSNTIGTVSQNNYSATPQEIATAVGELLYAIQSQKGMSGIPAEAADNLAAAEPELKEGRVPFGKLAKAIDLFQKAEDAATRAPEVMSGLHKLGQLLGVVS